MNTNGYHPVKEISQKNEISGFSGSVDFAEVYTNEVELNSNAPFLSTPFAMHQNYMSCLMIINDYTTSIFTCSITNSHAIKQIHFPLETYFIPNIVPTSYGLLVESNILV